MGDGLPWLLTSVPSVPACASRAEAGMCCMLFECLNWPCSACSVKSALHHDSSFARLQWKHARPESYRRQTLGLCNHCCRPWHASLQRSCCCTSSLQCCITWQLYVRVDMCIVPSASEVLCRSSLTMISAPSTHGADLTPCRQSHWQRYHGRYRRAHRVARIVSNTLATSSTSLMAQRHLRAPHPALWWAASPGRSGFRCKAPGCYAADWHCQVSSN